MVSTHRGHAHMLAKGGSLRGLISELYGKAAGFGRGQSGSMHCVDRSVNFMGATSIVGGTIPIGVGLAFAKKIKKEPGIVVVCIGDAAIEEGVCHESMNFAGLHNLKVIFFLENNLYSCFTHIKHRQPDRSFSHVAAAHGLGFMEYGGSSVSQMKKVAGHVRARTAHGPQLLVVDTYRFVQHCGPDEDDDLGYRDPAEVAAHKAADPLRDWPEYLTNEDIEKIDAEIADEFAYAEAAPFPDQSELGKYLFAT